jgi:hypothetical protein
MSTAQITSGIVENVLEQPVAFTAEELMSVAGKVVRVLGLDGNFSPDNYVLAYNRFAGKLEGAEKWLADELMNLAKQAQEGGWQEVEGLGMSFVSKKSACSACKPKKLLSKLGLKVANKGVEPMNRNMVGQEIVEVAKLLAAAMKEGCADCDKHNEGVDFVSSDTVTAALHEEIALRTAMMQRKAGQSSRR